MKTFDAVLSIKPWSASAGAKAELHKAWVKVRNIPTDKRCDATAAYVGSLVGVSLEIDQATLHKPEYCRVLIGCRNIHDLPEVAEGVLGDYFYDFYYEIDTIVVDGPSKQSGKTSVENRNALSPKRTRYDASSSADPSNTTSGFVSENSQSYNGADGGKNYSQNLDTLVEQESEEESEDDRELLIETLARERHMDVSDTKKIIAQEQVKNPEGVMDKLPLVNGENDKEKGIEKNPGGNSSSVLVVSPWFPVTPLIRQESALVHYEKENYLNVKEWPPLIDITEMEDDGAMSPADTTKYLVQTPDSSPVLEHETAEEAEKPRNQARKLEKVLEQATSISRKRNLEGLYDEEEREFIRNGAQQLVWKAMEIAERSSANKQATAAPALLRITGS